jgi:hypothetical protein
MAKRPWRWWYQYGKRFMPLDAYEPEKDWTTVDTALNAEQYYPLGFLKVKDYTRRGQLFFPVEDGVRPQGVAERKGKTYSRMVWTPHPQRHVRVFWGKLDRALKRLYEHGLLFTYAHTRSGYLSVTPWDERPRHTRPDKPPRFGRMYNYSNTTHVPCPSEESVTERAQDKRLTELDDPWDNYRKAQPPPVASRCDEVVAPRDKWIDMRAQANKSNPEHDDYNGLTLKANVAAELMLMICRKREKTRQLNVDTLKRESNGGACSTWTSMNRCKRYPGKQRAIFEPLDIKLARIRKERAEILAG